MIVNSADYITLASIADRLQVSRATVINDLKDIKLFIKEKGLTVVSHANKGLRIEGIESKRRKFLYDLLKPTVQDYENSKNVVSWHVNVQAGDQSVIQKILSEQECRYKRSLWISSFREIVLFLRILINRNQIDGEFLENQIEKNSDNYLFALDILKVIAQYCDVTITENDIYYFCAFLDEIRYVNNEAFNKNAMIIQMITREYITNISTELGINLNEDYDFFEKFVKSPRIYIFSLRRWIIQKQIL